MRRRRRSALAIVVVGIVVAAILLGLPFARKAVNELGLPLHYQDVIRQQAGEKHLDPALIAGVIYAETKFDARTSSAGATTFSTADLAIPQVNIAYGSYYLRYLLDEYHGSTVLALAAYNGGEANVDRWIATQGSRPEDFKTDEIPFPETRAYVDRVLSARQDYRHTYARQLGYG
jgi:soluble lytic murein transglycosylase